MSAPRPSLSGLIELLVLAVVVTFSLSAVSIAYAAGRHSGVSSEYGPEPVSTIACAPACA